MSNTDFSRTRAAIQEWDRYYATWAADLDTLCDSLEKGAFEQNNELVLKHFDIGIAKLCDTVGEAFAADTNGINNRDTVLDTVFGRKTRTWPQLSSWVRELAA